VHCLRDRAVFPICGYQNTFARTVKLDAVEGALDVSVFDFPGAEHCSTVGAAIRCRMHFSGLIAPKNEFFSESDDAYGMGADFFGFQNNIPLITNHFICSNIFIVAEIVCSCCSSRETVATLSPAWSPYQPN